MNAQLFFIKESIIKTDLTLKSLLSKSLKYFTTNLKLK